MSIEIPPLYHISFNRHLPLVMNPRQPWGSEVEPTEEELKNEKPPDPDAWIFAEFQTPRVSFSPSLFKCVQAVYANTHQLFESKRGLKEGLEFAVYRHDLRTKSRIMTPDELSKKRLVWDAHITQEYCFLDPVSIYFCGTVIVRLTEAVVGMKVYPFNDKSMKTIKSNVPDGDELAFRQTLGFRGKKFAIQFF